METNRVLEDNPSRWLITYTLAPKEPGHLMTKTEIIETEPSLWWRAKRWQEDDKWAMCTILMIHWIN